MVSKYLIISAVIAYVEARFGQENVPIAAISAVQGGDAGAAATIAGAAISDLLGGANACAKLARADEVFTTLGGGADALQAALGLVAAEKNTNPFANGNVQNVCSDPTLPATPELRGVTPLIDPDVDVDGEVNALSAQTLANPLNADGLSVFDLIDQAGLGNLVAAQAADGSAAGAGAGAGNGNANNNQNNQNQNNNNNNQNNNDQAADDAQDDQAADDEVDCEDEAADDVAQDDNNNNNQDDNQNNNNNNDNQNDNQDANNNDNQNNNQNNNNNNNQQDDAAADDQQAGAGAAGGADFGLCTPTITFQGGEGNRPDTEFTFQIADSVARGGQGEALNPNIITNALCNNLVNFCEANDAAVSQCEDAKAQVEAAGTRDKSTADLFNSLLGFAGAVTNPAGGPENPPAAARKMRRGSRAL